MMKAIAYENYGGPDVLRLTEIPRPVPKAHQILVRVKATTVTAADRMMRTGKPLIGRLYTGLRAPKRQVLGFEFAGEVVATGSNVMKFKTGDQVFGGTTTLGCYAEYVCISEHDVLTTMPGGLSFEEAAPVNGSAVTVMNFLQRLGNIQPHHKVLIYGASGGLGTYAVQLAKHFGGEVTGVCSTANTDLVRSLGADHVIDYTTTDFTRTGKQYDIIFDTVGKRSFSECKRALTKNGVYLSAVSSGGLFLQMLASLVRRKKARTSATGLRPVKQRLAWFLELKTLLESGSLKTVIDRSYSLNEAAEAHRYVDEGRKKGSVVLTV